jgi:hypothetical protein
VSIPSALASMLAKPALMSFDQNGTKPQRAKSRLRSPALTSNRTIGSWPVGAPFQVGGKFGLGRSGGIENASLISLTSVERRTRPHMARNMVAARAQANHIRGITLDLTDGVARALVARRALDDDPFPFSPRPPSQLRERWSGGLVQLPRLFSERVPR